MATSSMERRGGHRGLVIALFVLMLVVIAMEGFFLYQQSVVSRASQGQSDRLLTTFLQGDTAQATAGASVHIRPDVVAWVPFTMYAHLGVGTLTNTLVIALDRLIALPPNRSMMVDGNRIMLKPFGLFPPPRIDGKIASVAVGDQVVRITFAGDAIPAPVSSARNYACLRGGTSQFGRFRMTDTDLLIVDHNQANPFVLSLLHYADMIPRSTVVMPDTRSARITMPDF
jgi:hypothetical protein